MSLNDKFAELLPGMGDDDVARRKGPQQAWQEICFAAGAPGNETDRADACEIMAKHLTADTPLEARIWLLQQLQRIGRDECVEAVAAAARDSDARVRDEAIRALANNPSPDATEELLAALQQAADDTHKVGVLNALGYRADKTSVAAIAGELTNKNEAVSKAAAQALGKIATADATKALAIARTKADGEVRLWIDDAYLLCADQVRQQGDRAQAVAVYKQLDDPSEPPSVRQAAQRGLQLVESNGAD